jgi:hypothetical protein
MSGKNHGDRQRKNSSGDPPAWITPALIAETIRVCQGRVGKPMSDQDAVSLILSFGQLLCATGVAVQKERTDEPIHRSGPR